MVLAIPLGQAGLIPLDVHYFVDVWEEVGVFATIPNVWSGAVLISWEPN